MTEEWEKVQEALRKAPTAEAMREAAEAMRRYQTARLGRGQRSTPTLVSLGLRKNYPHAIAVDKIPDELARNPEFFKLMKRIVTKEKG